MSHLTDPSRRPLRLAAILLAAVLATGSLAWAGDGDHDLARDALRRGDVLPLTRILAIAEQHLPGEVLEIELETKKGNLFYELKILGRSGRVQELLLNARTGAFVSIEDD